MAGSIKHTTSTSLQVLSFWLRLTQEATDLSCVCGDATLPFYHHPTPQKLLPPATATTISNRKHKEGYSK